MNKFVKLTEDLAGIDGTKALWFSSGKDSRLLLEVMLAFEIDRAVLRFDTAWSRGQRRAVDDLIKDKDLPVYSYPPSVTSILGKDGALALACDYMVGPRGDLFSVVSDIVEGSKCAFDVPVGTSRRGTPPVLFEHHILGSKKCDRHWSVEEVVPKSRWSFGGATFHAPLYDWSDEEVTGALKTYFNIDWASPSETEDTGNLAVCVNCMKGRRAYCPKAQTEIDPVEWSPETNLEHWRQRHGIKV